MENWSLTDHFKKVNQLRYGTKNILLTDENDARLVFSGELEQISDEFLGFTEPLRDKISARDREKGRVIGLGRHGFGQVGFSGSGRSEE